MGLFSLLVVVGGGSYGFGHSKSVLIGDGSTLTLSLVALTTLRDEGGGVNMLYERDVNDFDRMRIRVVVVYSPRVS